MRISRTIEKKLEAVQYARRYGMTAATIHFECSKSMLSDWRKKESIFKNTQKGRRTLRKGTPKNLALEAKLKEWVLDERSKKKAVPLVMIQKRALEEAGKSGDNEFKASSQWAQGFLKRNGLSMRRVTSVGQPLPPNALQQINQFRSRVAIASQDITDDNIGNMDEVAVPFDIVYSRTVHPKGDDSVRIDTTGHEKKNFTVVLAVLASGEKLKPMLIFKKKLIPKLNFPDDVVIKANPKGWMNETVMTEWIEDVWRQRRGFVADPMKSLLILDSARMHLTERVRRALENNSRIGVIPGGLTRYCQPLDLSVNKCFKDNLRKLWAEWMSNEDLAEFTKTGRRKAMGYDTMAKIVKEAFDQVSVETVKNGFRKAFEDETLVHDSECYRDKNSGDSDESEPESGVDGNERAPVAKEDGIDKGDNDDDGWETGNDALCSLDQSIIEKFLDISFS